MPVDPAAIPEVPKQIKVSLNVEVEDKEKEISFFVVPCSGEAVEEFLLYTWDQYSKSTAAKLPANLRKDGAYALPLFPFVPWSCRNNDLAQGPRRKWVLLRGARKRHLPGRRYHPFPSTCEETSPDGSGRMLPSPANAAGLLRFRPPTLSPVTPDRVRAGRGRLSCVPTRVPREIRRETPTPPP
eukprot:scaffold70169_cov45-Cyclotella_meneghiniana.AAC.3